MGWIIIGGIALCVFALAYLIMAGGDELNDREDRARQQHGTNQE